VESFSIPNIERLIGVVVEVVYNDVGVGVELMVYIVIVF